jgi:zinc protease
MQALPVDKDVRIGKLDNGLTYYIRHNNLPENRVEFYIAQKVGSILEEPQQRGLAHFLEHMAFNGTRHFPGDENGLGVVAWCETKGIKFGTNLNAYTSVDQTVYNISNVPTDNPNVLDSCLLILHDWSNAINLADAEIDKERGVIREEWRSRNVGMLRIYTDAQSTLYPDSKYADCMPIGSLDVINNFPYQDIRDYYSKWYRPDLQGIIIVGDVDVDQIEAKLKTLFADVKAPVDPAQRVYYPVPDNDEPLIYIGKDKEVPNPSVSIFFKHDAFPDSMKNTMAYLVQNYATAMVSSMLNERFNELRQSPNPPFIYASAGYTNFFLAKTKEVFEVDAQSQVDGIETAIKSVLEEVERARRFGFTPTEYERARANYLQRLESAYKEREKTKSPSYVQEYVNNFLDNEPIPGIETLYGIANQIAPNIPVDLINQVMQQLITDKNQAVLVAGPDKEDVKYPTKEEIAALLKQMKSLDLKPYVDKVSDEPLISGELKGGDIVLEETDKIYGTTKLTLSNGVTVYVKPTDFKADQIMMKATSLGGTSLYPDSEIIDLTQLNSVAPVGGIGNFSKVDLTKALAGKIASVTPSVGNLTEGLSGNCAPKDFETMMQLTYLTFTAPRKDVEAFDSFKSRLKAALQNQDADPMSAFQDSITRSVYDNNPRAIVFKADMVDKIDYDRILQIYKERYADASQFAFYLVGNVDLATMKPLIAKYLGSLPATHQKETWKDNKQYIRKGAYDNVFNKKQQTPMANILFLYSGDCKYDLRDHILLDYLQQALNIVYTEEIREKEGGTYGVSCAGSLIKFPKEQLILQIFFQTDPAKYEKLSTLVVELLNKMAKEGPSEEQMQKAKEYTLKKYKDAQKENGYWMNNLDEYFYTGMDNTKDYEQIVNAITVNDVKLFLDQMMKQGNAIKVVMTDDK